MLNVTPSIILCKREFLNDSWPYGFLISIALDSARNALRYQFIIDSFDVWLPATNLGLVHLNDGVLGFTGYVFLMSILTTY
jgi:hypothetical protein